MKHRAAKQACTHNERPEILKDTVFWCRRTPECQEKTYQGGYGTANKIHLHPLASWKESVWAKSTHIQPVICREDGRLLTRCEHYTNPPRHWSSAFKILLGIEPGTYCTASERSASVPHYSISIKIEFSVYGVVVCSIQMTSHKWVWTCKKDVFRKQEWTEWVSESVSKVYEEMLMEIIKNI